MRVRFFSLVLGLMLAPIVSGAADPPPFASPLPAVVMDPDDFSRLVKTGRFPEEMRDSDGDGVLDIDDNCPNTPAITPTRRGPFKTVVDLCGCPIDPCTVDSDGDGVNDCDDYCPATRKGLKVDARGCPLPVTKPQQFQLDIKFEFATANLQQRFVPDLEKLASLMRRFPELTVTLEGHTDAIGSDGYNLMLSLARARIARDYLIDEGGVDEDRVKVVGYGKRRPVASNRSDGGRAQNRRTVALLQYAYEFVPANSVDDLLRVVDPDAADQSVPELPALPKPPDPSR